MTRRELKLELEKQTLHILALQYTSLTTLLIMTKNMLEEKRNSSFSSLKSKNNHSKSTCHKRNSPKSRYVLISLVLIPLIAYIGFQILQSNHNAVLLTITSLFASGDSKNPETESKMAEASNNEDWKNAKTIYEFTAKDIDGNLIEFNKYK